MESKRKTNQTCFGEELSQERAQDRPEVLIERKTLLAQVLQQTGVMVLKNSSNETFESLAKNAENADFESQYNYRKDDFALTQQSHGRVGPAVKPATRPVQQQRLHQLKPDDFILVLKQAHKGEDQSRQVGHFAKDG